jgi:transcriptional regulator with XRE-family HTH domain
MTISERISERLKQLSMTQKEFAEKTGILQSTISEWKKNKTNTQCLCRRVQSQVSFYRTSV